MVGCCWKIQVISGHSLSFKFQSFVFLVLGCSLGFQVWPRTTCTSCFWVKQLAIRIGVAITHVPSVLRRQLFKSKVFLSCGGVLDHRWVKTTSGWVPEMMRNRTIQGAWSGASSAALAPEEFRLAGAIDLHPNPASRSASACAGPCTRTDVFVVN